MATTQPVKFKPRSFPHQFLGKTLPAFVMGMVFGLLIALAVALFVSHAKLPFSGAQTQGAIAKVSPGPGKNTPDPNFAIYGKANANQGSRDNQSKPTTMDPFQQGTESQVDAATDEQADPVAKAIYFLQLGSFRNREDAEQLRARLAFIGTESEIVVGEVNDSVVNRVRVGPFGSANEAYKARIPLTKGGFEAAVIKE